MGKAVVRLELVGDDTHQRMILAKKQLRGAGLDVEAAVLFEGMGKGRPWIARLTGLDPRFGYRREFVRPAGKDYSEGNSIGSRGVYAYYLLDPGLYEVSARLSWKRRRRYFLRVDEAGNKQEIDEEEVRRCLANAS